MQLMVLPSGGRLYEVHEWSEMQAAARDSYAKPALGDCLDCMQQVCPLSLVDAAHTWQDENQIMRLPP